jgi:hypothetical protein
MRVVSLGLSSLVVAGLVCLTSTGCGSSRNAHPVDANVPLDSPAGDGVQHGGAGGVPGAGGMFGSGGIMAAGGSHASGGVAGTGGGGAVSGGAGGTATAGMGGAVSSGGASATGGAIGTDGGLGQDGASDAGIVADGGNALCGDKICTPTQLCIRPSCSGGTAPRCLMLTDAGTCPPDYTYSSLCQFMAAPIGPGCTPPRCVDPPPFCLDLPAACSAKLNCACLPTTACGASGGVCISIIRDVVQCGGL